MMLPVVLLVALLIGVATAHTQIACSNTFIYNNKITSCGGKRSLSLPPYRHFYNDAWLADPRNSARLPKIGAGELPGEGGRMARARDAVSNATPLIGNCGTPPYGNTPCSATLASVSVVPRQNGKIIPSWTVNGHRGNDMKLYLDPNGSYRGAPKAKYADVFKAANLIDGPKKFHQYCQFAARSKSKNPNNPCTTNTRSCPKATDPPSRLMQETSFAENNANSPMPGPGIKGVDCNDNQLTGDCQKYGSTEDKLCWNTFRLPTLNQGLHRVMMWWEGVENSPHVKFFDEFWLEAVDVCPAAEAKYLSMYADVKAWVARSPGQRSGFIHYQMYGFRASRPWYSILCTATPKNCNASQRDYMTRYKDVAKAYKNQLNKAHHHWVKYGYKAGRIWKGSLCDINCAQAQNDYMKAYPDIRNTRLAYAWEHYVRFGKRAGRRWPKSVCHGYHGRTGPAGRGRRNTAAMKVGTNLNTIEAQTSRPQPFFVEEGGKMIFLSVMGTKDEAMTEWTGAPSFDASNVVDTIPEEDAPEPERSNIQYDKDDPAGTVDMSMPNVPPASWSEDALKDTSPEPTSTDDKPSSNMDDKTSSKSDDKPATGQATTIINQVPKNNDLHLMFFVIIAILAILLLLGVYVACQRTANKNNSSVHTHRSLLTRQAGDSDIPIEMPELSVINMDPSMRRNPSVMASVRADHKRSLSNSSFN